MKRVLVINCFVRDDYAADFTRSMMRSLGGVNCIIQIVRMTRLDTVGETDQYTHLILSGSEASAMEDHSWYFPLEDFVQAWVDSERPLLGICYGHQLLARALAGIGCVRRAETPEFGWVDIHPSACPLLPDPVNAMVSHYDEVINLPADFQVMAASERCAIHAFQYQDLPVFGVQFHPEYGPNEADFIFSEVARLDPGAKQWFTGERPASHPGACIDLFTRFLEM